jgi:exopolyphosphatase/guanosine-5'-triphosphate,3'-diphosphate pyrophosphatase
MKFGAIDIGTNAARLLVGEVESEKDHLFVNKLSYTRIPLRLGDDVFETGLISETKILNFVKTMQAFRLIAEIFDVQAIRAVATSAMRDARNADEAIQKIKNETGIEIEVISGREEAELIMSNFFLHEKPMKQPFLVIDVGGGSTEISYFKDGKKKASKSFEIGTIRLLKGKVHAKLWHELNVWINDSIPLEKNLLIYGTGGNINKIHKLIGGKQKHPISISDISDFLTQLKPLSFRERIDNFQLKPDRADVIVPAMEIYLYVMTILKTTEIFVPKVGLSDGVILDLHKQKFNFSV